MASEAAPPLQVPPLPPKLRPRPQRSVGAGGEYADETAFEADDAAWLAESKRRGQQMRERHCVRQLGPPVGATQPSRERP